MGVLLYLALVLLSLAGQSAGSHLDDIALSSCIGISSSQGKIGHITAVRRTCSASYVDCKGVCSNLNSATIPYVAKGAWSCMDSLHVYKRPANNLADNTRSYVDSGRVGYYAYRYNACGGGCGPNYCCCKR